MKIEIIIFYDYKMTCYNFGKTKFCFDEYLTSVPEFGFGYLTDRFKKIYEEEINNS